MFDVEAFVEQIIAGIKASFQTQLEAAVSDAHDKGVEEGKASSGGFSQADLDAAVAAAVAAKDQEKADALAALKASVSALVAAEDADLESKIAAL